MVAAVGRRCWRRWQAWVLLTLAAAFAGLVVVSYWPAALGVDRIAWSRWGYHQSVSVELDRGWLDVDWHSGEIRTSQQLAEATLRWAFKDERPTWRPSMLLRRRFGFVSVPMWIPIAFCLALAAWSWRRGRRRYPPRHCQRCGYDLTGNVSGRCPECGSPARAADA